MSDKNVSLILRADAVFNFLAGVALQLYIRPVLDMIGWPEANPTLYAAVLGSALIGLSLAVWLAARRPQQSRDPILASVVAKGLAGVTILYHIFVLQTYIPNAALLVGAVGVQVLFVLGEAAYLLAEKGAYGARSQA